MTSTPIVYLLVRLLIAALPRAIKAATPWARRRYRALRYAYSQRNRRHIAYLKSRGRRVPRWRAHIEKRRVQRTPRLIIVW